jgi:sec-independent protein translocase protein TatA
MVGLDNPLHIAMVLVVVLLVFGAKRLPEMGKSLGEGLRGFKDSVSGDSPGTPAPAVQELPAAPIAPIAPIAPQAAAPQAVALQAVAPHAVAPQAVVSQAVADRDPVGPAA